MENQFAQFGVGQRAAIAHQPDGFGLLPDAFEVEALAIVGELDDDFIAFLAYLDGQLAGFLFACRQPLAAAFDAVHDRVAQQVLERRRHFLQHAAVDLDTAAADVEADPLVDFLCGLARDAIQPFGDAAELHHAHPHQVLLQVARQARLLLQVVAGLLDATRHVLLHRGDVGNGFGNHAAQFLQPGKAVELERIEAAFGGLRHLRIDLRFGLDFQFTQLRTQARHVFGQLGQRLLQPGHAVLDTRAGNRHFAGLVDQAVDDVGPHPHQRRIDLGLASCRRCRRRQSAGHGPAEDVGRQPGGIRMLQLVVQVQADIEATKQVVECRCRRQPDNDDLLDPTFHVVHLLAQPHGPGHPRAALDGMQQAAQALDRLAGCRLGLPGAQQHLYLRQQVGGFLEEYRQQVRIELVARQAPGIGHRLERRGVLGGKRRAFDRVSGVHCETCQRPCSCARHIGWRLRRSAGGIASAAGVDAVHVLRLVRDEGRDRGLHVRLAAGRAPGNVLAQLHQDGNLVRRGLRHLAQRELLQHGLQLRDGVVKRVILSARQHHRLARQRLQHALECIGDFLKWHEAHGRRTACQRMRCMYGDGVDAAVGFVPPFGQVLRQKPHEVVGFGKVDVMQRNADFQLADALDAVVHLAVGRVGVGKVDDLGQHRRRICGHMRGDHRIDECGRFSTLGRIVVLEQDRRGFDFLDGVIRYFRQERSRDDSRFLPGLLRCQCRYGMPGRACHARLRKPVAIGHLLTRLHQCMRRAGGLAGALQFVDPGAEFGMRAIDQIAQIVGGRLVIGKREVQGFFHAPRGFAEGAKADHAPAALQCVEGAAQRGEVVLLRRRHPQRGQGVADGFQHLHRLAQENFQQFGVDRFVVHGQHQVGRPHRRRRGGRVVIGPGQVGVGKRTFRFVACRRFGRNDRCGRSAVFHSLNMHVGDGRPWRRHRLVGMSGDNRGRLNDCHRGNDRHIHFPALAAARRRADEQIACRIEAEPRPGGFTVGLHAFHEKAEGAKVARHMLEFRAAGLSFEFGRRETGHLGAHIAYCQHRLMLVEYCERAFDLVQDAIDRRQHRALRGIAEKFVEHFLDLREVAAHFGGEHRDGFALAGILDRAARPLQRRGRHVAAGKRAQPGSHGGGCLVRVRNRPATAAQHAFQEQQ